MLAKHKLNSKTFLTSKDLSNSIINHDEFVLIRYKMNEIVNRFLLTGDKLMPEMHFKKTRFTYSVCGPFTKNKERIQKFKDTEDSRHIYQNQLDKACFKHDMILKMNS